MVVGRSAARPPVVASSTQESALCAHLIDFHAGQDVRYGDMAVLVPTNAEADRWQHVLAKKGIREPLAAGQGAPC